MSLGYQSEQIYKIKKHTYTKKTWSQSLSLASRVKALELPLLVETSNAESPTMIYIATIPEQLPITHKDTRIVRDAMYIHPTGRPRCFVFD